MPINDKISDEKCSKFPLEKKLSKISQEKMIEIIYLGIGLIIGVLLGAGGIILYKQKKTDIDLNSFK